MSECGFGSTNHGESASPQNSQSAPMISSAVILALLTLLVATEPGPGQPDSFPGPAGNARAGLRPAALRRSRRQSGRHWPAR